MGGALTRVLPGMLVVLLGGCATAPHWPGVDDQSPPADAALQARTVLEDVPFHAQERYQCGPAALAMMLNSQGLNSDPDQLRERVYLPGRKGSLQVEMVAAARAHALLVYPLDGTLESLLGEVAAGQPVLVMQNLAFDWWPQWHFAVVVGFDARARTIILHSGTRERHETPLSVFHRTWSRAGRWAVVMLPPDQIPASASPLAYLAAANDLESTGQQDAALAAYRAAEERWPGQPAAIFGQGNVEYARGNVQGAADQFARLVTRFPRQAAGWNNLAHTLGEIGCAHASMLAQRCAAALAPGRFSAPLPPLLSEDGSGSRCLLPACPVVIDTGD